ncbi:MAG TPA: glycosyltransferase family 4 protein [Woeseiaceae bacterium]|nr:glycosyltransferase family 4 protein [Woeseiaceae bacterium]
MRKILFVDPVATKQYDERDLQSDALGGTEATVVRIAEGLALDHLVVVAQSTREWCRTGPGGVVYAPYRHKYESLGNADVDAVVVVRAHKVLPRLRRRFPDAAMYLWMHCNPGRRLRTLARTCVETNTMVVAVSDYHLDAMTGFYARHDPAAAKHLKATRIYNPVAPGLTPDGTPWDPNKLLFLSSPHKGLEQVLDVFGMLKRRCSDFRLCVANPGYLNWRVPRTDGVIMLGKLRHDQVVSHLRDSLCLFYPQTMFEETFGLVFAEANALGTPVIAHAHGAAPEILDDAAQLCDGADMAEVCDRMLQWREGARPLPRPVERFALPRVLAEWERLLQAETNAMYRPQVPAHASARA